MFHLPKENGDPYKGLCNSTTFHSNGDQQTKSLLEVDCVECQERKLSQLLAEKRRIETQAEFLQRRIVDHYYELITQRKEYKDSMQ
jgi:formate dehydrogenase assembly factor FdhD